MSCRTPSLIMLILDCVLHLCILEDVTNTNQYFIKKWNVVGKSGSCCLQKAVIAMCTQAYKTSSKSQEEHTTMAKSTAKETMLRWCKGLDNVLWHIVCRILHRMIL